MIIKVDPWLGQLPFSSKTHDSLFFDPKHLVHLITFLFLLQYAKVKLISKNTNVPFGFRKYFCCRVY